MSEVNDPPVNAAQVQEYQGRGVFVDEAGIIKATDFSNLLRDAVLKVHIHKEDVRIDLNSAIVYLRSLFRDTHKRGNKIIFIGNGGSSAIASHMAVDFTKNADLRAIAFNDAPTLTCIANDFGSEEIFSKQLEYYARSGDFVVIVSSSGKSPNILAAAEQAFKMGLQLVTFSGMNPDNVLRRKGHMSFWVPAMDYGIVELAHLTLLHSVASIKL